MNTTPLGSKLILASPCSWYANPRSMSLDPNPRLFGAAGIGGPPVSRHSNRKRPPFLARSMSQRTATRPSRADNAPYFAAFVDSSCSAMPSARAAFGVNSIGSPSALQRPESSSQYGLSSAHTSSVSPAPRQSPCARVLCVRASVASRCVNLSWKPLGSASSAIVCAAIDCTVASVFLTR